MNNTIIQIGRICKNVELRYTKDNKAVCEVKLAVQNGKDDTSFIPFTVFGKTAELINNYCKKGDMIGIQGIVKNHNWEDKEGNKHYEYAFIGNKVSFLATGKKEVKEETKEDPKEDIFATFGETIAITDNVLD